MLDKPRCTERDIMYQRQAANDRTFGGIIVERGRLHHPRPTPLSRAHGTVLQCWQISECQDNTTTIALTS